MLLNKIYLALLLASRALATPVPGKELATRAVAASFYRPPTSPICRARGEQYALATGRRCIDSRQFLILCTRNDRRGRALLPVEATGSCDPGYFCMNTKERELEPAPRNYKGITSVACVVVGDSMTGRNRKGDTSVRTSKSRLPVAPLGKMLGSLTLDGGVGGSKTNLQWDYTSNADNNKKTMLIGNQAGSSRFDVLFNYEHDAEFFGVAQNLNPNVAYTLTAFVAWFPTSPLAAEGEDREAMDEAQLSAEEREQIAEGRKRERALLEAE